VCVSVLPLRPAVASVSSAETLSTECNASSANTRVSVWKIENCPPSECRVLVIVTGSFAYFVPARIDRLHTDYDGICAGCQLNKVRPPPEAAATIGPNNKSASEDFIFI